MKQDKAQQTARDEKFVPLDDRVKIGKSNLRMDPSVTQREETYQAVLDIIENAPCYNAFIISADVPEIYMQQFWLMIKKVKRSSFYQFDIDNKTCQIDVELCINLGESLELSSTDVKVDYAALIWENLQYQIDYRQSKVRRREIMAYPSAKSSFETRLHALDDCPYTNCSSKMDVILTISLKVFSLYSDMWITNEIKKSEAYKMYFKYFTCLIYPKKGRGGGAQGIKATDAPKQTNFVRKKTTDASKKKLPKRKSVLHDESNESEGEPENRRTGRKKRTPRALFIQEPLSVHVKKTQKSSGKFKGIKWLSNATQLEIDTQKSIKASKRESKFQHQSGCLSEGVGLRPEVPDEPIRDYADSDEGAGTSPKVSDESKDKKEKLEDILWLSTYDDGSENDDEEDYKSIDIEMTDDERTDTDVEDQVKGVAKMIIVEEAKEENTKRIGEQKDDEELKVNEEQKGDDQDGDVQELKQADHSTVILASIKSQVPSVVKDYLGSSLPDASQKVLQSHTKELKNELFEKRDYKDVIEELVQAHVINKVKNFLPKFLPQAVNEALEKTLLIVGQSSSQELFNALTWSMLLDETNMGKGDKPNSVPKKRNRGDNHDEDPSAGSNHGKTLAKTSKSGKSVTAKELVEEPVFEKALNDILKKDWFKDSPKPEVLDPDWNTVKIIDDASEQSWFNEMVQAEKPPLTFDELMSTPIDFSVFIMNRLKLNKITREVLVGPVFNLLKGTCESCVELEYNMEECFRALTDQLDWANPEGHKRSFDMSQPLPLQDKDGRLVVPVEFFFNNDLEYLKAGNKERSGKEIWVWLLKEGELIRNFTSSKKLFNLDGGVIVDFVTALKMFTQGIIVKNMVEDVQLVKEPYTPNYDPPGFIYKDKSKKKRLMRLNEIHKFCDETLQSVRKIIRERLLNFKFGYNKAMP
ncbi:hypothetical protein Tco_0651525 [Tanacetum coccineum]|uniref:Uncharacterized protein n=1 Tax=Tanacetum coccineum TaxID=301880 RepID=A0ABQ4WV07_9ASTR